MADSSTTKSKYIEKCRGELLRVLFKLEAKKMASHPIFNAVLVQKLFELWNLKNVKTVAGYLHDSKIPTQLIPYAWVLCDDEADDPTVTDTTFYANHKKPIRLIGPELDFSFASKKEDILSKTTTTTTEEEAQRFRYLETVPSKFTVIEQAKLQVDDIQKQLRHPEKFLKNCPKSYQEIFREITDTHITPSDLDDDITIEVNMENMNGFLKK
jgi:hypothetical protein